MVGQNWNFIKIIWFLHHLKFFNQRISEWAHIKKFGQAILVLQKWAFFRQDLEETYIWVIFENISYHIF